MCGMENGLARCHTGCAARRSAIFGLGHIGALGGGGGQGPRHERAGLGPEELAEKAAAGGYEAAKNKADLFERSDVLSISVRLRPETRGIVGPDDLARMKPTALFVNVARAELVAPGALLDALKKGRPGYAAVDVYEKERSLAATIPI